MELSPDERGGGVMTDYFGHPLSEYDDPEAPLWCASFDSDLLRVVPKAAERLGDTIGRRLWTRCRPTNGKINAPAAWNDARGMVSFFTTHEDRDPTPAGFWCGDQPVVECTFLDAIRDEWIHGSSIVIDGHLVWTPPQQAQLDLMYDLRGWKPLSTMDRSEIWSEVRWSIRVAAQDFKAFFGTEVSAP